MSEDKIVRKLRKQLETALAKQKDSDAIAVLGELIEAEPKIPRWPHKRGELYRKHGKKREAIECYTLAADLYTDQGFLARAVALAKTIIDIDPRATQVLERIDPQAAQRMHRQQRPGALSARPVPHPALLPDSGLPPPPAHPAILLDDAPPLPRHAAILPESDAPLPRHAAILPEDDALPRRRHPAVLPEDTKAPDPATVLARVRAQAPVRPDAPRPPAPPRAPARDGDLPRVPGPPRLPDLGTSMLDMAEELTIAPDVRPNETRFSNAPPARRLRMDLTDLELRPRKPAPPSISIRPPPPPARSLSQLPLFPLFAELPQQALVELVKGSDVIELQDGALVMRRGDATDALYGIVEGSVDVMVPGQITKMTLAEGDVFGESALLQGEKRHADVVVRGHLVALRIPRQTFNHVASLYPRMAELLLELLTRRLLGNLLASSPLFQEFDARARQELAHKFEVRRAPRNTVLAEIGKAMDALYVNLTGALEVIYADGRPAELHESGTMFGQSSLLTQDPSDITVKALYNMLVLRLPGPAFQSLVMQYPGVLAHVSELASNSVAKIST
jgi:CRP-like cAMP-binding protein